MAYDSSRHGRFPPGASTDAPGRYAGWIPVALGAAAVVAGMRGRNRGAAALAVGACAVAAGTLRGVQAGRAHGSVDAKPEVERSITIGKSADVLRDRWRDPHTLPQVMAGFATVSPAGDGRMRWKVDGSLGRGHEWETETVDRPGGDVGWRSLSGAALASEGWLRLHPAPADRGTVVTLHVRFDPPGGALGDRLLELLGATPLKHVADGVLRRFKNLVETGEIPTTARQSAARADTH